MESIPLQRVRSFNRIVTLRTGALNDSYLGRGRSLGHARILFEIGTAGLDMRTLRDRLGLDSGYLSRVLQAFERQGLVSISEGSPDRRRRNVALTAKGQIERAAYDTLSDDLARSLLAPLSEPQQQRLLDAMAEVEKLMKAASVLIEPEAPDSVAAQYCLDCYFAELAERFENGFDRAKGNAAEDALMAPPNGSFLIARLEGLPVACGALKQIGPQVGEIKRMWVAREARGLGLARRLLQDLETVAHHMGMTRVCLDTNRALTEAQAMYRKAGYRETTRYNDNPYADFWFEKEFGA